MLGIELALEIVDRILSTQHRFSDINKQIDVCIKIANRY